MSDEPEVATPVADDEIELVLEHLKEVRAFDFTGYKRASLTRRVRKRMQEVGVDSYPAYLDLLQAQPNEFGNLFNTILINVTSFFRDAGAWEHVAAEVVPRLLREKGEDEPVRVWSAGCASGQEAYTLAMVLCDAMGDEAFRARVKIYGSDVDDDAILQARQARYPVDELTSTLEPAGIDRYFVLDDGGMTFRKDLRRSVIFGRHDLVQDPPISRIDLLVCRNTLMYFNADVQRRVLGSFHFALRDGGFLFLGKSEAMVTRTNLFSAEDVTHHVFTKRPAARPTRPPMPRPNGAAGPTTEDGPTTGQLLDGAFESGGRAQLLIDAEGRLARANRHARILFGLTTQHVGRPFKDLELSYRPVELRSRLEQVLAERRVVSITDIEWELPTGGTEVLEARLSPVGTARVLGVSLEFVEIGQFRLLREELQRSQRQLETAHEELQSTVEELETTNEELQSTNEELETTNEELHSTNEELETMNEELQSTNEELETINDELREQGAELDQVNLFFGSILSSFRSGVAVLSPTMVVRVWNDEAEELWGLRADEVVGDHFLNLDIGLPVTDLSSDIRGVLATADGPAQRTVAAVNRRGRRIECTVTVSALVSEKGDTAGVIVLMDRVDREDADEP